MKIYDNPRYYEMAFGFRNIPREVDFFEGCMRRFSKVPVKVVLEVGCGTSPYLEELARRGFSYVGLDIKRRMLDFTEKKAAQFGIKITTVRADMRRFTCPRNVDFVFTALGSLHITSNKELRSHLDSVARCLKVGGLYLIDGGIKFDLSDLQHKESWTIRKDNMVVRTTYSERLLDPLRQTYHELIKMRVKEGGKRKVLMERAINKFIFPQEFLEIIRSSRFEFVGWFNNFDLRRPLRASMRPNRPVTVLRRRGQADLIHPAGATHKVG